MPPNLRIRGHLPAPIINGDEIDFENGPKWSNFRLSWPPDLDRAWSLAFFISHRVLPVYQLHFIEIEETFCGRTDGRTDGKLPPIVLGRLPKFGSRPKNVCLNSLQWKNKFDLKFYYVIKLQ